MTFKRIPIMAPLLAVFFFATSWAAVPAAVVGITDGDTLRAVIDGQEVKVRLYGIDAPEKRQPYGQASTTALKTLTQGHAITITATGKDRYGRTIGLIYADGNNVNESMVTTGMAWVFRKYCRESFCRQWEEEEVAAKINRRGLWLDETPVPPWEWRHR